jgi:hypothetical protein
MSYHGCIEIQGTEAQVIAKLNPFFPATLPQLTPRAKMFLAGQFEGQCLVYKPNTTDCLCPIRFMWMPPTTDHTQRKLWLWCHPAAYDHLAALLNEHIEPSPLECVHEPPNKKPRNDNEGLPVSVTLLRDSQQLARFRLIGPLAMAILKHALQPSVPPGEPIERGDAPSAWWSHQTHSPMLHQRQVAFWNSTSSVMPNRMISLVIRDPRIFKPVKPKRTSETAVNRESTVFRTDPSPSPSIDLASSPLWTEKYRTHCSEHRLATYQIHLRRSNMTGHTNVKSNLRRTLLFLSS